MEVLTSLICLSRLCYTTKVLYRLYFCTILFCNFLQIKTHFYCSLYFCAISPTQGPRLTQARSPSLSPLLSHWLVSDLVHQLSTTNQYSSGEELAKLFFVHSTDARCATLCQALSKAPRIHQWLCQSLLNRD